MTDALLARWAPALQERLVLLLNHVLSREPAAMRRLAPHAGRAVVVQLAGAPGPLAGLPALVLGVTPAGLWERLEASPPQALHIEVDARDPLAFAAMALGGARPAVDIRGDAQFAAEISWLIDHLRWDVEDDLARITGPAPARMIAQGARAVADALRGLAGRVRDWRAGA